MRQRGEKNCKKSCKGLEGYLTIVKTDDATKSKRMVKTPKLELVDEALWIWSGKARRNAIVIYNGLVLVKGGYINGNCVMA
ncbi:hypothetical protein J6590_081703 [Homalodisca vitripennis]|nr:hypothetical protein J6590_081703 [Homalodisca vitripennis]